MVSTTRNEDEDVCSAQLFYSIVCRDLNIAVKYVVPAFILICESALATAFYDVQSELRDNNPA